jgi:hypothetical protein
MWPRILLPSACNILVLTCLAVMTLPQPGYGQGLELGGGRAHVTGDNGTMALILGQRTSIL